MLVSWWQIPSCPDKNLILCSPRQTPSRIIAYFPGAVDLCPGDVTCSFVVIEAFDTVDHRIHLERTKRRSMCSAVAAFLLLLFALTRSAWSPVSFHLPQGSISGPLFYVLYTVDLRF